MKILKNIAWAALGLALFMGSCSKDYGYDFENGYNSGEYDDTINIDIDTNRFKIDYSKYTQARLFPGLMSEDEPRLENFLVQIDLNYEDIRSADLRIQVAPGNWQSTGVYAPAGELIVIDVPAGIYGLTAQIGAHVVTSDAGIDFPQRDLEVFSRQVLFPGRNYMRNLYGGLVYILPARPLGRIVDLHFSGVAKAPSFKLSGLGATTVEEWRAMVTNTTVPWFELEGRWMVFTLETAKLKKYPIEDPKTLMETWDTAIGGGYWEWYGLTEGNPDIRHRAPFNKWRVVHDVLFRTGVAQVSGYPIRARNTDAYFTQATSVDGVKNLNWGTYHELGHNMQMHSTWSFAGNGEVTNNLFHFQVSRLFGHQSYKIAEVWHKAVPYIAAAKDKDGVSGVNWHTYHTQGSAHYNSNYNDVFLMMWAQVLERYGYDFMTYMAKRGREARFTSANDQSKIDFYYESLSEFTETDMEPYLNQWGLYVSAVSKRYVSETKGYPLLNRQVWNFNPVTGTGGTELIPRTAVPLSNVEWTITANSWDTRAASHRPPSNLIDEPTAGWNTSLWHPCVTAGGCGTGNFQNAALPNNTYEIEINTVSNVTANGFALLQRPSGGNNHLNHVRAITVEVSSDGGATYRTLGTYDLLYATAAGTDPAYQLQNVDFHDNAAAESFNRIRFKINKNDVNGDASGNAVLAELGLYTF